MACNTGNLVGAAQPEQSGASWLAGRKYHLLLLVLSASLAMGLQGLVEEGPMQGYHNSKEESKSPILTQNSKEESNSKALSLYYGLPGSETQLWTAETKEGWHNCEPWFQKTPLTTAFLLPTAGWKGRLSTKTVKQN